MIRPATAADAAAIAAIYNHYVATTTISFEEHPVGEAEMAERIAGVTARLPWLVCERDGAVKGYAYATPWRVRSAYRYSVESSVYVSPDHPRQGVGKRLYLALIEELRARGIHMVIGGIAQPNEGSVALHESVGFVKVAHFKEVGWKFERWVDVGYWELRLDTDPPP
ncbi:arsinothricin resistance N-acetyltransferase ArsN1 family B [Pseudoduganella namucuonensis]|uniref:Phosphinothricin acetyltransferase n=1 Tax=Pseudoduganella namucuonensis TaxID=1035707 RepID=A0A1I7G6N7_9BURK|nr:arsinothricin resistance N-acetyltransferase ArsN1 family B [Pseudoduganella namucuonensis]SFU44021.1 phosphinothricin acetyltransferase [Pseudoduganella namucuonensis]